MTFTDDMLHSIMPHCSRARRAECFPYLISAMLEFDIITDLCIAAFLATIAVESAELRYFTELATGDAYEGRRDLGNIYRGDGRKYRGRGAIQVTGRTNAEACLEYLRLPVGQPELLAETENAFRSAGWFWSVYKQLNTLADTRKFLAIQVQVNGRNRRTSLPNHWSERLSYYELALRVLPEDITLTPDDLEAAQEASLQNVNYVDSAIPDYQLISARQVTNGQPLILGGMVGDLPRVGGLLNYVEGGAPNDPAAVVEAAAP